MASVTGLTADRMLEIEAASVVGGEIVGDDLILTKHDASTINAGNVRGPTGPTGPTGDVSVAMLNAAILAAVPVGVVWDYIEAVPPTDFLTMVGQTIIDGETEHPELWDKLPASMKSGPNIVFPDTRKRASVGYDVTDTDFDMIGKVGGSKTHTLTQAELPAATIAIDPPSTTVSVNPPSTTISIDPPSTTISIDPPSTNTGVSDIDHFHTYNTHTTNTTVQSGSGSVVAGSLEVTTNTGISGDDHYHTLNIPAFNATVDIAAFNATVDIAAFNVAVDIASFNSGNLGSGEGHSSMQPYVVFLKIIKVA